jgi:hypothetical protein
MSLPASGVLEAPAQEFYRHALEVLREAEVPVLVGGAYAFARYTGIVRHTKDIDLFLRRADVDTALAAFTAAGYRAELVYEHWLAKVFSNGHFVDLIFNLGNGVGPVDDQWFDSAEEAEVLGVPVLLVGPDDMIWSKVFVMDRGRYDGADIAHLLRAYGHHGGQAGWYRFTDADIAHLLRAYGHRLNWRRLLARFDRHWRVLLSHLVMFGFVYPGERGRVPEWVMHELTDRLQRECDSADKPEGSLCRGTLLTPTEYQIDVDEWGYRDPRLPPQGGLSPEQIEQWTEGVREGR